MKDKSTTQSVKIQIPQEEPIEMDIPIPSYYALVSEFDGKSYLSFKVCSENEFIYASTDNITISPISNLYIFLKEPAYKPCEPEIFYKHLADVTAKINAIAGVEYLPLVHELSDEDLAEIRYHEGRELINEDRHERDESRKDDICHDPNY
jgi:hypothetical protein